MKVQFYLARPTVKNEKGKIVINPMDTSIVANIHLSGKLMRVGVKTSVDPKYWDHKSHRAKITPAYRPGSSINKRLHEIKGEIEKCYYDYLNAHNAEPSQAAFRKMIDRALGRSKKTKLSFYEYFEDFIKRTKAGQRQTAKGTIINRDKYKSYGTTLNKLKEFNPNLDFDAIDLEFYNDWLKDLRNKKYSENNIGSHIKNLKSVLNEATDKGANTNLEFRKGRFVTISEEVDNIALTEEELKDIKAFDLSSTSHLDRVRDLFLVGCYTGLRYSDFSRLTADHIKGDFIEITQSKTGNPVAIPVHPVVKSIINKYDGTLPESISNQKTNEYLKGICKEIKSLQNPTSKTRTQGGTKTTVKYKRCEIVSTHTARRTFATNAYLQGVPTVTIMAITGHRTEKAFLKYIKVTPREHAKIMAGIWAKNKNMSGKQIFESYIKKRTEYSSLLMTLFINIGEALYSLLEQAEKDGKKLGVTPEPTDRLRDEYTVEDIIFIEAQKPKLKAV